MRIFTFIIVFCSTISCRPTFLWDSKSETQAMSSKDWFKNGVDRFYLASLDAGDKIHPAHKEKYGDQFFFGIGCYGEPKDPETLSKVKETANGIDVIAIPLNKRTKLHQFPLYYGEGRPKKPGYCKILLGSEEEPQQISRDGMLKEGGDIGGVATVFLGAAIPCVTSAVLVKTIFLSGAAAGAGAPVSGGTSIAVLAPLINAQTVALGSSAYFCAINSVGTKNSVTKYQMKENQKLFSKSLDKASEIAISRLKVSGEYDKYKKLQDSFEPSKMSVAAAIWNRYLIESYNEYVDDRFENGWGTETKFFDAVSSIETEVKKTR